MSDVLINPNRDDEGHQELTKTSPDFSVCKGVSTLNMPSE